MGVSKEQLHLEWCQEQAQVVSRTFAISIDTLAEPYSTYVCLGYLLCRIPDTIEDDPALDPETKRELLETYADALRDEGCDIEAFTEAATEAKPAEPLEPSHWTVVEEADKVVTTLRAMDEEVQEAIVPWVRELVFGMYGYCSRETDRTGVRIDDLDDLERYCYYVASTVGYLLTDIFQTVSGREVPPELWERSKSYGMLLQLCNISKDVHSDFHEENNVYIPEGLLTARGVRQEALLSDDNQQSTAEAVEAVIDRATGYVDDARAYLQLLPNENREYFEAWALPYLLAIATLRELERNTRQSLEEGGVKITREEVGAVIEVVGEIEVAELRAVESLLREDPLHTTEWRSVVEAA